MAMQGYGEYDTEAQDIANRQRYAELLRQQGMAPMETRQVGRVAIRNSPLEGLAKMLQVYGGQKGVEQAGMERKALAGRMEGERSADTAAMVSALRGTPARPQQMGADDMAMIADQGGQANPMTQAVPGDPNAAAMAALQSRLPDIRAMAPGMLAMGEARQTREDNQAFRGQEAQAAREARAQELQMRLQDARTSAADRMAMQRELAQMQIDARRDMASQSNALRRDLMAQGGKPPPGYRPTQEGNLEAIPGGPADQKMQGAFNQDTAALTGGMGAMDRLATAANEAMQHPGLAGITGLRGAIPNIPGSQAADAQAKLNTLKSQVAFGVLQDMRNNSKTGGALGAVSDAEGKRLEANLAALENAQSYDQMKDSLKKIIDYTSGAKERLQGAYNLKHQSRRATDKGPATSGSSGDWAVVK